MLMKGEPSKRALKAGDYAISPDLNFSKIDWLFVLSSNKIIAYLVFFIYIFPSSNFIDTILSNGSNTFLKSASRIELFRSLR